MKTRRKTVKTPAKGKRSSIICVKKSPLRRNPRRNVKHPIKSTIKSTTITKLLPYESPLKHLRYNRVPGSQPSVIKKESAKEEKEQESEKETNSVCLPSTSKIQIKIEQKKINYQEKTKSQEEDNSDMAVHSPIQSSSFLKRKKNKKSSSTAVDSKKSNFKKRKLKKSPLSRLNESNENNESNESNESKKTPLESIIIVDDSDIKPTIQTKNNESVSEPESKIHEKTMNMIHESVENTRPVEPIQTSVHTVPGSNNEEVVVIDCNDSSLMEMEAYHEAFNQFNLNGSTPSKNFKFTDSIIVIDPDDEHDISVPTTSTISSTTPVQKQNDDCFVVWSSLPKPSTSNSISNSESPTFQRNPYVNINFDNSDLLKCDKILFDTNADVQNLRYLNNENSKPSKKKSTKIPKSIGKGARKSLLQMALDKAKNVRQTVKSTSVAAKTTTKVAGKSATTTTAKKTLKKSSKNNQLIFLSESKDDKEAGAKKTKSVKNKLREIVIDGNNCAMAYTHNKTFSENGIKILIEYFTKKGHTVKVFIPQYRRSRNFPLLEKWYIDGIVIFTPSRKLGTKSFIPYDDRYILEYATACDGIVVSQDQFRDLYAEKPEYRDTIENRLLVPTFVGDYVMFPEDPLGRDGPTLTEFLKH